MLKKALSLVLVAFSSCIFAFPASVEFHFEKRMFKPYPAAIADRVTVDHEKSLNGHSSMRLSHQQDKTTAYSSLNIPQAPCELEMVVNACALKRGDLGVTFNFNLPGGPNGSAGSARELLTLGTEWEEKRIQVTVPPNSASVQVVLGMSGMENTVWLNEMRFGFALDSLEVPVAEHVDWNAPLDSDAWNGAKGLYGYFTMGSPSKVATSARVAADRNGLYVATINPNKPVAAAFAADAKDASLWNDDCNELFLFNVATGKGWQFIVNSNGALFDAQIYQQQDGDPWKADASWNSEGVKCAAKSGDSSWESRLFIPWKTLGLSLDNGLELGINIASENKAFKENSMWNCFAGSFNDPAGFAKLRVADGKMAITRSRVVQNIVYKIGRAHV